MKSGVLVAELHQLVQVLGAHPDQSEASIDNIDQSEASIDNIDQSEASIDNIDQSEASIDNINQSEVSIDNIDQWEASIDNIDQSEASIDNIDQSEASIDKGPVLPDPLLPDLLGARLGGQHTRPVCDHHPLALPGNLGEIDLVLDKNHRNALGCSCLL